VRRPRGAAAVFALLLAWPRPAAAASWIGARLWQESFFWDALMSARDKAARQAADPQLLPAMKTLAEQVAQQAANIKQIQNYAKSQQDNLRYAFSQDDPKPSLATIRQNLDTLAKGTDQIRHNLYYLTARCRLASGQALPDPELTTSAAVLIGQIQQVQLQLNALYTDTAAIAPLLEAEAWTVDKFFRHGYDTFLQSVVSVQDSVFTVYNSAYEIHVRSR